MAVGGNDGFALGGMLVGMLLGMGGSGGRGGIGGCCIWSGDRFSRTGFDEEKPAPDWEPAFVCCLDGTQTRERSEVEMPDHSRLAWRRQAYLPRLPPPPPSDFMTSICIAADTSSADAISPERIFAAIDSAAFFIGPIIMPIIGAICSI